MGLGLFGEHADLFDAAGGGLQDLEAEAALLDGFAGERDVSGDFGDQAADGGGVPILGEVEVEELFEAVGFKGSEDDVAVVALADGLVAQLAFVAEFADNFLDEILDRDQAGDAAVFVDDDGHAAIFALHLIEQFAGALGLRNEINVGLHQAAGDAAGGVGIGHLEKVARRDDADDVVEIAAIDGNARERMLREQVGELLDRGIGRDGDDGRARGHDIAHGLIAELNDGVNEFAIALLKNALVLTGLDQCIDGLGGMLGLFVGVLRTGERDDGLEKSEEERERKDGTRSAAAGET